MGRIAGQAPARCEAERARFTAEQRREVRAAQRRAGELVTGFYRIAPREWASMAFEVRTLDELDAGEVTDSALAQVLCYGVRRTIEDRLLDERDLFRICVQDHRILRYAGRPDALPLRPTMLYVLTHELVHVVRFGQRMQRIDLPPELRAREEASVDRTARTILHAAGEPGVSSVLDTLLDRID